MLNKRDIARGSPKIVDCKINRNPFSVISYKALLKLTFIFLLGFLIGAQIAFSPFIDTFIKSFLKIYLGLELPLALEKIPFKSIFLLWLMIFSVLIIRRFIRADSIWLTDKKEKVFITLLIISSQFIALTGGKLEISDFVALFILIIWCFHTITDREYKIIWTPLYIPLLFFFLSVLLSIINGKQMSFFKLPAVMKSIVVFILMVNMIKNRETALFSLKTLILITALSAIIGILQEIIFFYKGIEIAGVIQEDVKRFMWQETPFGTLMRVPAFTSWYTILANHLSIALIVGINFILYSILTKKKEKLFLYIAMILMSIALYFTFSYSSILIVLSAFIFSIMLRWISLKIYVTLFFVILLLGFFSGFIPDFLADPKKYFMTEDLSIRIELLRDGITGFLNRHPFIGNGVGTGHKYTSNIDLWPVHNNFVLIADEIGLFGLLTYCIFFFAFIFRQVMSISKIKNTKDRAIALSLIIAFIAYLINLQLQAQHIDFFIFLYLGLIEAIISTLSSQTAVEISAKRKV